MTICLLPAPIPQIAVFLGFRSLSDTLQQMPPTATWLLPLLSVVALAGYASYLQWWDGRNYQAVFGNWDKIAKTHGFRNLSEIAMKWIPQGLVPIVNVARESGSFLIEFGSLDVSFRDGLSAVLELNQNKESDFVRVGPKHFIVHPDLLKQAQP